MDSDLTAESLQGLASAQAEFAEVAGESLFPLSPDAILVTDKPGVIRAANPRAIELFGYPSEELTGLPIEALVPARFRARHPAHRDNYAAHPRTRQMGATMNLFAVRGPQSVLLELFEESNARKRETPARAL